MFPSVAKKIKGVAISVSIFLDARKTHERFNNFMAIVLRVAISWLFLKWLFPWLFFISAWLFFVYVAISVAVSVGI